jgi:hypothetical protein
VLQLQQRRGLLLLEELVSLDLPGQQLAQLLVVRLQLRPVVPPMCLLLPVPRQLVRPYPTGYLLVANLLRTPLFYQIHLLF